MHAARTLTERQQRLWNGCEYRENDEKNQEKHGKMAYNKAWSKGVYTMETGMTVNYGN